VQGALEGRLLGLGNETGASDGNTLLLNVVNRHADQPIEATIALESKSFTQLKAALA